MKKTNLEMLIWGMQHVAENHGFKSSSKHMEEDGSLWIIGDSNIPTLSDVQMLCEDCQVSSDNVTTNSFGIEVILPFDANGAIDKVWANKKYKKPFHEFWKRLS